MVLLKIALFYFLFTIRFGLQQSTTEHRSLFPYWRRVRAYSVTLLHCGLANISNDRYQVSTRIITTENDWLTCTRPKRIPCKNTNIHPKQESNLQSHSCEFSYVNEAIFTNHSKNYWIYFKEISYDSNSYYIIYWYIFHYCFFF